MSTTRTDAHGRYAFAALPALATGQHYTVSVDGTQRALATPGYTPTGQHAGSDTATDSSTGSAESGDLTTDGQSDPTLDFGFVSPAVSVGDYVWNDSDADGIQDPDEPGIPGVTVTLTGPNGAAVTDVYGDAVTSQVTDAHGGYHFTGLPALPAGQRYVVHVDNSQAALSGYVPTRTGGTSDTAKDSSTRAARSSDLTVDDAHDDTLDFGFVAAVAVGDFVWEDLDGNGRQDPGEPGIADVAVTISRVDGQPVRYLDGTPLSTAQLTTTTNSRGHYLFSVLEPGAYTVTVTPPSGYQATTPNAGAPATDSSTGSASSDYLDSGQSDVTLDFGFVRPVTVGDVAWDDYDRDGVQDADEPGLPGVAVTLSRTDGTPVTGVDGSPLTAEQLTRQTGEHGQYSFSGLTPGQYTVSAAAPTGYLHSTDGFAISAALPSDGTDDSLDFGFYQPAVSVGDVVFVDADGDGVQDPGDTGLAGVTLSITGPGGAAVTDVDGRPVGSTTTDGNGGYTFDGLPALPAGQDYTVSVDGTQDALHGYLPTRTGQGTTATDSSTGTATSGDLTHDGDADPTLDFGFVAPVTVGDSVWRDTDRDGVRDAGEPGLPDVTVTLSRTDGGAVTAAGGEALRPDQLATTTDTDGGYDFAGLAPGQYTVTVTAPDGYLATTAGSQDSTVLSSGQRDDTLDFGFKLPAVSVGDLVWDDLDGDGVQETGAQGGSEPGIPGVTLSITGPDGAAVTDVYGQPVSTVTTDANGAYRFRNLPALASGVYTVTIDNGQDALAGYVPTQTARGTTATDSSDGSADAEPLPTDQTRDTTLDFGFVRPVSVGDYVWQDTDRDGLQGDPALEPGIAGVRVTLARTDGQPVLLAGGAPDTALTRTTDPGGGYTFTGLNPGQYTVTVLRPRGYSATSEHTGSDTSVDSSTGSADSGTLRSGQSDTSLDFGFFVRPAVSVGDFVWDDLNGDGVQDAGEPGLPGVTLSITGPDGAAVTDVYDQPVGTTSTDTGGAYVFRALPPLPAGESYTVHVDDTQAGLSGYTPTTPDTAASGELTEDTDSDLTLDFGFVAPVSVGDFVWRDTNRNGVQDRGEPGLAGVTLTLSRTDGAVVQLADGSTDTDLTRTTGDDGRYAFTGLAPGQYTVTVTDVPGDYLPTAADGTDNTAQDSSDTSDSSAALVSGGADNSLDFGFVLPAVGVGDLVWLDRDGNGVQDAGDPGIAGVHLTLTGPGGGAVTDVYGHAVGAAVTDAAGGYAFADLPALTPAQVTAGQAYTVHVDDGQAALRGLVPTVTGAGTRADDSSTTTSDSLPLSTDGASDETLDFGFVRARVGVGDLVWFDGNHDGVQQASEPGIGGVVLTLSGPGGTAVRDVGGARVGDTTTDEHGHYRFADLPTLAAGQHYTVVLDAARSQRALAGYAATVSGAGDRAHDSSTGAATSATLSVNGAVDPTLDFGFYRPAGTLGSGTAGAGAGAGSGGVGSAGGTSGGTAPLGAGSRPLGSSPVGTSAGSGSGAGSLSYTGVAVIRLAGGGLLIVLAGLALGLLGRRRRVPRGRHARASR